MNSERLWSIYRRLSSSAAFPFPQWEALASILLGEALRLDGSLEQAERAVQHGMDVATHVGYGYAAGLGERIRRRIQSG